MNAQLESDHKRISLISHLHLLKSRINIVARQENKSAQAVDIAIEQLPYSVAEASMGLLSVASSISDAISDLKKHTSPSPDRIWVHQMSQDQRNHIAFAIDAYLDAARRAQNSISPYISKILRISLAKSLPDIVKSLENGKTVFPDRIANLVTSYWARSGKLLKHYRDLAQHHAVVSSDGRITIAPDGQYYVYLVLPNNPEQKNPELLQYVDPRIDAFPYIQQSYIELYSFLFELTHVLLSYTTEPRIEMYSIVFRGPVRFASGVEGYNHEDLPQIANEMLAIQEKLTSRLNAELPRTDIVPTLVVPDWNKDTDPPLKPLE
jgi:hypothetical protein